MLIVCYIVCYIAKNIVRNIKMVAQKNEKKNWSMISFIHSGSEIRIYRVSSGNNLDQDDITNF